MVFKESLLLVAIGIALGIPTTLAVARFSTAMLFGVSALDPVTIGIATALLLGVAAVASLLPARRAAKVDPIVALRCE